MRDQVDPSDALILPKIALAPHFATLVHADWSAKPGKRWAVIATREGGCWTVHQPFRAEGSQRLLDHLFDAAARGPVLAGFDFPIGLPASYGKQSGFRDFGHALDSIGTGDWADFYRVAESPSEISLKRPFYPQRSSSEAKQWHLSAAHGVSDINGLRRRCEMATSVRRAACPLFWTLGGNQVGKAAIAGWREVVKPARSRRAAIWPFDGDMHHLAAAGGLVIAETYPAEAYGHIGLRFRRNESKRQVHDRCAKSDAILRWAARTGVRLSDSMLQAVRDGFGGGAHGEDRFDAALGLFGMLEVVTGRRSPGTPSHPDVRDWEGWILGQSPCT